MTRRTYTLIAGVVLLIALGVTASQLPVQYVALGPGVTLNTIGTGYGQQIITVKGTTPRATSGHLNMTTVSETDHLDLISAIRGWLAADTAVVPREEIYPANKTDQQIAQQDTQQFKSSQAAAVTAALGYLHYGYVVVQQVEKGSPATGKLRAGDTIASLNGTRVSTRAAIAAVMTKVQPGTTVSVGYVRDAKFGTTAITTEAVKGRAGSALGVDITAQAKAPFDVSISSLSNNIGGPSAGLMFALGIVDKVGPTDLTGGRFIAGTGEINPFGDVAPIGGIPLKMIGARQAGATVFLSPAGNCAEATSHKPAGLTLVRVTTLSDAVTALKEIDAGKPAPAC